MFSSLQSFAHVKWFIAESPAVEKSITLNEIAVALVLVLTIVGIFWYIDKFSLSSGITKQIDSYAKQFRSLVPLLVRVSTGLFLLINVKQDYILAPNVVSDFSTEATVVQLIFILSAVLIFVGLFTDMAAILLGLGYLLILTFTPAVDVIDHLEYIGISGYLLLRGSGKYSLDYRLKRPTPLTRFRAHSLAIYRVSIGFGLAIMALSEKLLNISGAQDFLNNHHWNIVEFIGVSDRNFIIIAGVVELAVGIALILNLASRLTTLVVLSIMILTALLLGIGEVYGHLFAVGFVIAIWVNDKKPLKNG